MRLFDEVKTLTVAGVSLVVATAVMRAVVAFLGIPSHPILDLVVIGVTGRAVVALHDTLNG